MKRNTDSAPADEEKGDRKVMRLSDSDVVGSNNNNSSPFVEGDTPTISQTPNPPYYAVIFTSNLRTKNHHNHDDDANGGASTTNDKKEESTPSHSSSYSDTAKRMVELARQQPGYLGLESARDDGLGISISYWKDTNSIKQWKANCEHMIAQEKGRQIWYKAYKTRICKVERDYGFSSSS